RPHVWQTDQRGWNVGLEQQTKLKGSTVSIYPNPSNHTVSIAGGQGAQVSITSITGQQVWSSTLTNNTFSVGHLPKGLYLVTVQLLNGNQSTHKLVVQH
nr:T9SS type A sorting domain-containing protein [Bacteroidia bacterium]